MLFLPCYFFKINIDHFICNKQYLWQEDPYNWSTPSTGLFIFVMISAQVTKEHNSHHQSFCTFNLWRVIQLSYAIQLPY